MSCYTSSMNQLNSHYEIIIIGAGPGGSEAAKHFSKAGFSVLVIEKEKLDREKVCGGGVFVQEILEFGELPKDIVERSIRTLKIDSPNHSTTIALPEHLPSGAIVKRSSYDSYLQDQAKATGAKFIEQAITVDILLSDSNVEVTIKTSDSLKKVSSRLLIDASGYSSNVANKLGLLDSIRTEDYVASYKYWIELPDGDIDKLFGDRIDFYFNSQVIPDGYIWIFPKQNVLDVGIGTLASNLTKNGLNIKKILNRYISNHPDLKKGNIVHTKGGFIPARMYDSIIAPSTMMIGDAAGLSSPIHGGGIYYARLSGKMAAEHGIRFLNSNDQACLSQYQAQIRDIMYEDNFKWDYKLRPFLGDDELVDMLVDSSMPEVTSFFVNLFTGTVKHSFIYKRMQKTLQDLISEKLPVCNEFDDMVAIPKSLDMKYFNNIAAKKILVAISYCLKSVDCPAGRFSSSCKMCGKCDVGRIVDACQKGGFAPYIVSSSSAFIEYLDKYSTKYDGLISMSCPYIANRIGLLINKQYGLVGYNMILRENICTTDNEYQHGEKHLKDNQTNVDTSALFRLLRSFSSER